ncbi:MAG: response regulator [Treponema sp.]|nr:response regulator [Treponema sp.]
MEKIVFIVDDNDANLVVAASALEDEYKVLTIPSAQKLFSLLEKKTADLILLDVEMPDMTGLEAIVIIRENERQKNIPVIFLTSRNDEELKSEAVRYNVLDIIYKPIVPSSIKECVKKHIGV